MKLYLRQDRYSDAESSILKAIEISEKHSALNDMRTIKLKIELCEVLMFLQKFTEAEALSVSLHEIVSPLADQENDIYYKLLYEMCSLYYVQDNFEKSDALREQLLNLASKKYGEISREVAKLHQQKFWRYY